MQFGEMIILVGGGKGRGNEAFHFKTVLIEQLEG